MLVQKIGPQDEQSGVESTTQETIENLAKVNQDYQEKFGYIFIVCATGKSAEEMLQLGSISFEKHDPEIEIHLAMAEQQKITLIRLQKLLEDVSLLKRSHITTHVLDTSIGSPGKGILVRLLQFEHNKWQNIGDWIDR